MIEAEQLVEKLLEAWRELRVPDAEEVRGLEYEYGDYYFDAFAGLSLEELDRWEIDCLIPGALHDMKPYASAYYLAVYLVMSLEDLRDRMCGKLVLDYNTAATSYGVFRYEDYLKDVLLRFLPPKHLRLVIEFARLSLKHSECLSFTNDAKRELEVGCGILETGVSLT